LEYLFFLESFLVTRYWFFFNSSYFAVDGLLVCLGLLFPFFPGSQVVGFSFLFIIVGCLVAVIFNSGFNLFKNLVFWRSNKSLFAAGSGSFWHRLYALFNCHKVRLLVVDGLFYVPMQAMWGRLVFSGSRKQKTLMCAELQAGLLCDTFVWASCPITLIPYISMGVFLSLNFILPFTL